MEKFTIAAIITLVVLMTTTATYAGECCSAYTDLQGKQHNAMLCADYCCFDVSASFSKGINAMKTCCADSIKRVPQTQRQDDCVESWITQHIWVPIVSGIVFLIILIACCTCCCCCGCCGACRKNQGAGVIIMPNGQPQSTVMMSNQMSSQMTNQVANPAHQGYDQ